MLRFVPPAGAPLEFAEILRAAKAAALHNGNRGNSITQVAEQLGPCSAFGTRSGRAALWLILKALHRIRPDRKVVALPAYTCFTVPASVVRAGLTVCPIDINPETLDFDFSQLEQIPPAGLLCVVACNLFGLVNDLERVRAIAAAKEAFVVDDAAQALGASRNGYFSGLCGDVGFFSFGRGKALAAIEGGLIVTNSEEISSALRIQADMLPKASRLHSVWTLVQMLGYAAFLAPRLYWIPNSIPFLKLGSTEFAPDFPISGMSELSAVLISQLIGKLTEMSAGRERNAISIAKGVRANPRFVVPEPICGSRPVYTRLPIIASDKPTRDRAVTRLRAAGIGATSSYPSAICDIPGIERFAGAEFRHCPRAESLAKRLLTLPTHRFVSQHDISRMGEVLTEEVRS
jgi:dTDP-4-amino-4,6-dideoxygalactose transaminase